MDFKSPGTPGWEQGGEPFERRMDWKNERVRMEDRILDALMAMNREFGELKTAVTTLKESWDSAKVQERLLTLESSVQRQADACAVVQRAKAEADRERAKDEKEEKKRPKTALWVIGTSLVTNLLMYLLTKFLLKN